MMSLKKTKIGHAGVLKSESKKVHCLNERLPLLIAGSHLQQTLFRKAFSCIHLFDRGLSGPIESLDQQTLIGLANKFMEQHLAQINELVVAGFRRAKASGLTSTNLVEISQAAAQGRIQSLLVAEDQHLWGMLDRTHVTVQITKQKTDARSVDELDDLAELTLLKDGQVTVRPILQMPAGSPVAAILRWSHSPDIMQNDQGVRP